MTSFLIGTGSGTGRTSLSSILMIVVALSSIAIKCMADDGGTTPAITDATILPIIAVGDVYCIEGYVMDSYCIDRGTLLDRPSVKTLEDPSLHSIHCLVDVSVCVDSHFEILTSPTSASPNTYGRGWRVTQETKSLLVDLARSVGTSCSTCSGRGRQSEGFRAAVEAEVVALQDGEIPPIISIKTVFDSSGDPAGACAQQYSNLPDSATLLSSPVPTPGDVDNGNPVGSNDDSSSSTINIHIVTPIIALWCLLFLLHV